MSSEIVLWSDARYLSPWVLSVWVALKEKGIAFQVQELDLGAGEHKKGDYPRMTVTGKVPALTDGDAWIAESLAILEYLEDRFPTPPFFPLDPVERAHDRQVLAYLRSDFGELRRCMPFEGIFLPMRAPAISKAAREECRRLLELVDWRLAARGKAPLTAADFELAAMLRRPIHYRGPMTPQARAYSDAIWKRPSVRAWLDLDRSRFERPLASSPRRPAKRKPKKRAAHRARTIRRR